MLQFDPYNQYEFCYERDPSHPEDVPDMRGLEVLDVRSYCHSFKSRHSQWDVTEKEEAKIALLHSDRLYKVTKLVNLYCDDDPEWAYQLLYMTAPQLKELQLFNVGRCHLETLLTMPWLQRLEVDGWDDDLEMTPFIFPSMNPSIVGLEYLRVFLPRGTTLSLIRMNGPDLKEMELTVGLKLRMNSRLWICSDLNERLASYGLPNLTGLLMRRADETLNFHPVLKCRKQRRKINEKMPWCDVLCDKCNKVTW